METVVLPPYFNAYLAHVCPLRRVPAPVCVQTMCVPPPLAQLEHLEIAAQMPPGLQGLVLDELAREADSDAAFVISNALIFQEYARLFEEAAEIGVDPGWNEDDDPVPRDS
jgi:hypothetical protein